MGHTFDYQGPMLTGYPSSYEIYAAAGSNGGDWNNPDNFLGGSADGSYADVTIGLSGSYGESGNDKSQVLLLKYTAPDGQGDAEILGFSPVFKGIATQFTGPGAPGWSKGLIGISLRPVDQTGTLRGLTDSSHESNYAWATPGDWWDRADEHGGLDNADALFFWGPAQLPAATNFKNQFDTFNHLSGIALWWMNVSPSTGSQTYSAQVKLDTLLVYIAYTPVPPGPATSLTFSNLAQHTAASLSLDAAPSGDEQAFDVISRATSEDTSVANASNSGGVTVSQTYIVTVDIAAGQFTGEALQQVRLRYLGYLQSFADVVGSDTNQPSVSVDDMWLLKSDGTSVAQLSDSKDPYAHRTATISITGVGGSGDPRSHERYRTCCLDVSGVSSSDMANLAANGGKIAIRWTLNAPENDAFDDYVTTFSLNAITRIQAVGYPDATIQSTIINRGAKVSIDGDPGDGGTIPTHFKITEITDGTLTLLDGTAVSNNDYVSYANAHDDGLIFLITSGKSHGSFKAAASYDGAGLGLGTAKTVSVSAKQLLPI